MTHINPRWGFGYRSVSQGWQGGDICLRVVFIIMMLKNPGRSFGEMGQGKKKSLCGIFLSSFWVFKKKNSLKKKHWLCGNWYQCGCGFTLGDYFQSIRHLICCNCKVSSTSKTFSGMPCLLTNWHAMYLWRTLNTPNELCLALIMGLTV